MSSGGQIVGGIVGAVVGFYVGGPAGAVQGAALGMGVGGYLDPPKGPTIEGPRLNDLSVQTSTYGQFIPRTYGTIGLSGNVFWLENNAIQEKVKKKKSGGKGGGGGSTIKTYSYYATFAVGLCEGPIAGVRRIWVGPDLVYDAGSGDLGTIIASNQAAEGFSIYLGTDTQQPDPRMQAEMGVANCPAYRGLAYIVMKDLPLADYGNSVAGAQVKVEVVNSLSVAVPSAVGDIQINGTPVYSDFSVLESATPQPGYVSSVVYVASSKFTRYDMQTRQKVSERTIYEEMPNSSGSTDPLYFFSREIIGKENGAAAISAASSTVRIYGSGASIYIPDITGDSFGVHAESYYDGEFYWFGGASNIYKVSKAYNVAATFPIPSSIGALRFRIRKDKFTGRMFFRYSASVGGEMVFGEFAEDPTVPLWSYSLGYSPGGDGPNVEFSVENNIAVFSVANSLSAYDVLPAGLSLIGSIPSTGAERKQVFSTTYPICYENGRLCQYTDRVAANNVPLSDIVYDEAMRSNLIKPADIDTSGLTDSVTGFKVTATGSIRNAIEPLRGAWPFDVVQSGYKIKATTRGSASVVTIPVGELAIDTQLTESREMDSQLPQNVTVKHIDREREYDQNEQRAQRDNTEAVNSLVIELPVVLSANQAAQVADKLIRIYALEKSDFSFVLPAPYRYLEPGDVITIATDDADFVLRLVSVNYTADGRLECAGRPSSASTYTSIAPGDGGQGGDTTIPLAGSTIGIIIDCPVIDEGLQDAPGFASALTGYSAGWPGGVLYQTADGGQTWVDLQAFQGKATAGTASTSLSANAGNLIQKGGSLTVSLISGALESVTESQMLNGANIAAYGASGRWEIIRFQNATLNGDGTYTLDTFWRGDRGTEWATGLHAANDYFVLMTDPDLAFVGMPTDSIGQPRDYRAITIGADIDSATSSAYTYAGVNLETYSGAHAVGSRASDDLNIKWQRRTRVGGAWRDNVDASLGETSEAYEVDIMDGATVKRTITATTPSVLYTSAMQVTDFGSAQASVSVKIYQLSSVVGRGYPLEATL